MRFILDIKKETKEPRTQSKSNPANCRENPEKIDSCLCVEIRTRRRILF